jgi:Flp pilus assembly protein TadG
MVDRLRSRTQEESGVVLVLVAIMLVVFLGMAALAVDLGSFYGAQRKAQAAADAGALAAAGNLATSTSAAQSAGTTYASTNFPGVTTLVTTPYNSSASEVKVVVNTTTPVFFGKIFGGSNTVNVSATAVAGVTSSGPPAAIFSYDSTCGSSNGLLLGTNGSLKVTGGVHSNGSITASNTGATYGASTYGGPSNCSFNANSGACVNTYGSACSPTVDASLEPYPIDYRTTFPSDPSQCTFSGDNETFQNEDGATLANGTYCYNTIDFNSANLKCTCTFWASQGFQFNQTTQNFTPYFGNLLYYYSGTATQNFDSNGNASLLDGATLFAPNASVTINTPGDMSGFVEAKDVTINGSCTCTWTGTGPGGGSGGAALLQ